MARPMVVPGADITFPRNTLRSFADTVALTRALQGVGPLPYPLVVAQGAAFDIATIEWCILFGSDDTDHQQIHWKNMFEVAPFREGLLNAVGLPMDEWRTYRQGLVDYRNELAAHRDLNPKTRKNPNFDTALKAASYYHERLVEYAKAKDVNMVGPSLMEHFEARAAEFSEWAKKVIA